MLLSGAIYMQDVEDGDFNILKTLFNASSQLFKPKGTENNKLEQTDNAGEVPNPWQAEFITLNFWRLKG